MDRDEGKNEGEDEDPSDIYKHRRRWACGEGPAHVDRVVERGDPGNLGHRRWELLHGEEDARKKEERRNDQGEVVSVEVYALDQAGKKRPHDAEHHPDDQQHWRYQKCPERRDERFPERVPEHRQYGEEACAVQGSPRPRPQVLSGDYILGVDRSRYYGVVDPVYLELYEGVKRALEGGREHGVAR